MIHHDGTPLTEPLEAQPPPEIGRPLSAGTNVIDGRVQSLAAGALKHKVPLAIMYGSGLGTSLGFLLGLPAEALLTEVLRPGVALLTPMCLGMVLGPLVALGLGRSPRTTTFVGDLGLARVTGGRVQVLRFIDVDRVEGGAVIQRVEAGLGVAATAGARLDVSWRDPRGRRLFCITGLFDERYPMPRANSLHFARAALAAWSAHAQQRRSAS